MRMLNYTPEQVDEICRIVDDWMGKHDCYSAEKAYQNDECNTDAIDLVGDLAEVVGIYYED